MQAFLIKINNFDLNRKENNDFFSSAYTGIKWGCAAFPFKILTFGLIYAVASTIPFTAHRISASNIILKTNLIYAVVIGPLFEEVVTRLGIQNGIKKIQNFTENFFPKWVSSPRVRVIATGVIFASLHLLGAKINIATTIARITFLIFFPIESVLFEKSGFVASFFAHATHNALVLAGRGVWDLI